MTLEGEPGLARPQLPDKKAIEITTEEAVAGADRDGFIDPQVAGEIIAEHFIDLTPEQFDANNRRANPHMYPNTPKARGPEPTASLYEQYILDIDRR